MSNSSWLSLIRQKRYWVAHKAVGKAREAGLRLSFWGQGLKLCCRSDPVRELLTPLPPRAQNGRQEHRLYCSFASANTSGPETDLTTTGTLEDWMCLPSSLPANGSQASPPSCGSSFLIKLLPGSISVADPRHHAFVLMLRSLGKQIFWWLQGGRTHKTGNCLNITTWSKGERQSWNMTYILSQRIVKTKHVKWYAFGVH